MEQIKGKERRGIKKRIQDKEMSQDNDCVYVDLSILVMSFIPVLIIFGI